MLCAFTPSARYGNCVSPTDVMLAKKRPSILTYGVPIRARWITCLPGAPSRPFAAVSCRRSPAFAEMTEAGDSHDRRKQKREPGQSL